MLARRTLLIFLNNGLAAALGLVGLYFLGQYVTATALGMFAFAHGAAMLVATFAQLGLDQAHARHLAAGADLGRALRTYATLRGAVLLALALLFVAGAALWDVLVGFFDSTRLSVMLLMAVLLVVHQGAQMVVSTFNGMLHTAKAQTVLLVENVARLPALIVATVLFGASIGRDAPLAGVARRALASVGVEGALHDATGALLLGLAYLVPVALSLVAGLGIMARQRYPLGAFDRGLARSYARLALPLAAVIAVSGLALQLDKLMVGFFWSASEVGHYFMAQRVTTAVLILPGAVGTLFFPLISELAARDAREGVREVVLTTFRALSLIMVPVSALLFVLAPALFGVVIGTEYLRAAPVLSLLSLHALAISYLTVTNGVLMGFARTRALVAVALVTTAANVVLNVAFIPTSLLGVPLLGLGARGAALATVVSTVVGLVASLVVVSREFGDAPVPARNLLHLVAGLACGAAAHAGLRLLDGVLPPFPALAGAALLGLVAYAALLALLRELRRGDWLLVLDVLHPGKMVRYIREELSGRPR